MRPVSRLAEGRRRGGGGSGSRRGFLKQTGLAVGALASVPGNVHGGANETLKVGLIGCGGRGTGAAAQALRADPDTKLVAMADAFGDRIQRSLQSLKRSDVADRVAVADDCCFTGFDGYKRLLGAGVDVVLLATPPQFRPLHLRACVEAGKHIFAEKPVAVDAPGVRSVLATGELARKKSLVLVSGLCWRYETGMQETIKRVQDGAVGHIVALNTMRYAGGVAKLARRQPDWTDMQWQMRNWYYFTWLSGDFIVEQFVHELDKMAWVMGDQYPVKCVCSGGRQARIEPEYGHIYDHFDAVYDFANGVKLFAGTRHQRGCSTVRYDLVLGSRGRCYLMKYTISGDHPWKWPGRRTVMHQLEHDAMFAAIRAGKPINNCHYMAKSTMMAIMARMSAYTGKALTWEQALNSQQDLSPPRYDWDVPLPVPPVARPGVTRFY